MDILWEQWLLLDSKCNRHYPDSNVRLGTESCSP